MLCEGEWLKIIYMQKPIDHKLASRISTINLK